MSEFTSSNTGLYDRKPSEETILGQVSHALVSDVLSKKGMTGYLIAKTLERKNSTQK